MRDDIKLIIGLAPRQYDARYFSEILRGIELQIGRLVSVGPIRVSSVNTTNFPESTSGLKQGDLWVDGTGTIRLFDGSAPSSLTEYESGSWTPDFAPSSGAFTTLTYFAQSGTYTKTNTTVFVSGSLGVDAYGVGTGAGELLLTGLPFNIGASHVGGGIVTFADFFVTNNPRSILSSTGNQGSDSMNLIYRATANGTDEFLPVSDLQSGAQITFTIVYETD